MSNQEQTQAVEPLPRPFCDADYSCQHAVRYARDERHHTWMCAVCGAHGPLVKRTGIDAPLIAAWNTRVPTCKPGLQVALDAATRVELAWLDDKYPSGYVCNLGSTDDALAKQIGRKAGFDLIQRGGAIGFDRRDKTNTPSDAEKPRWIDVGDNFMFCTRCKQAQRPVEMLAHERACWNTPSDGSVAEKNTAAGNSGPARDESGSTLVRADESRPTAGPESGSQPPSPASPQRALTEAESALLNALDSAERAIAWTESEALWSHTGSENANARCANALKALAAELRARRDDPTLALREAYRDACVAECEAYRVRKFDALEDLAVTGAVDAAKRALDAAERGAK